VDHIRIDEGVKRGPRKQRIKPNQLETAERQARSIQGKFLAGYSPEVKAAALAESLEALEHGHKTVAQVAEERGIPQSTLYSWLVGSEPSKARTKFFDQLVTRAACEIRTSQDPLELARAREELSGWLKIAAVRDSREYGPKQEVTHNIVPILTINAPVQWVIEHEPQFILPSPSE